MTREQTIVCVTNSIPDLRSCVVKDQHRSNCDGFARVYDQETGQTNPAYRIERNTETGENDRWLIPCGGCLPRRAELGQLCQAHTLKLGHALETDDDGRRVLVDLVTHMWSIESGGVKDDNDRVASAFGSQWTLSESHILANEIYTDLAAASVAYAVDLKIDEYPFTAAASILDGFISDMPVEIVAVIVRQLVEWIDDNHAGAVKHRRSAEATVRALRTIQAAMHKFPLVDAEHRIPFVRCPGCARMTLTWKPPLMNRDEVIVKCERCGHEEDQDWLEFYISAVKTDPRRRA